jgi:hypothetical protein
MNLKEPMSKPDDNERGSWPSPAEAVIFIIFLVIVFVVVWNLVDVRITPPNEWWR